MSDYSATFEQVHSNLAAGDERRLSGTVYFLRPGMMRWDYAAPEPKHLIANGDRFWSVEPARGQYYEGSLSSSQLPTALRFLMGQGQLAEDFEVSLRDSSTEKLAVPRLTPCAQPGLRPPRLLHRRRLRAPARRRGRRPARQ